MSPPPRNPGESPGATAPSGHAAVLRLQHGRLLRALARHGPAARASAEDLPRELVRRGGDGRLLWPGYGDNVRVLKWIVGRIHGQSDAQDTPIGHVPSPDALDLAGMDIARAQVEAALHVERDEWIESLADLREFYKQFGTRLPAALPTELARTARRLTT